MSFKASLLAALAASCALAHMVMNEPPPYNLNTQPFLSTSPLSAAANLPFPCQGKNSTQTATTMQAGGTQKVTFHGQTVHGGGSCQFSVAYGDVAPADPKQWKVIYSIIGGCPADKTAGTVQKDGLPFTKFDAQQRPGGPQCGDSTGLDCVRQFDIPIPKEMKNGPVVFAWTWFNRIGNREMYMNCAPAVITGGTEDQVFVDKLPPMFVANSHGPESVCTFPDGTFTIGFPEPGEFGIKNEVPEPGFLGACPAATAPNFKNALPVAPPAGAAPAGGSAPSGSPAAPAGAAPAGAAPAGAAPAGAAPAGAAPAGSKPAGAAPAGSSPAGSSPAGSSPAGYAPPVGGALPSPPCPAPHPAVVAASSKAPPPPPSAAATGGASPPAPVAASTNAEKSFITSVRPTSAAEAKAGSSSAAPASNDDGCKE